MEQKRIGLACLLQSCTVYSMAEVNWKVDKYLVHLRDMDDRAILCECLNSREGKG